MPDRAYHHGDLRASLLEVGLALLDDGGVEAVTIRAAARAAGVAHSAPANHFRDRAALLGALAVRAFEELSRQVDTALQGAAGAGREERLRAVAATVIDYALRHPHRYRLLWRRDCFDAVASGVEAAGGVLYNQVKAALATAAGSAEVSPESEVIAAWSLVHGYVSLRIEGTLVDARDEVSGKPRAAAILDVLVRGLPELQP